MEILVLLLFMVWIDDGRAEVRVLRIEGVKLIVSPIPAGAAPEAGRF